MSEHQIFNTIGLFLAGSLIACGPIPVRPAPIPTALPLAPVVSSCAVNPPQRQPIDLREVEWIGRAGDRTWVLAKSGTHRVLLRLTEEKFEPFVLPDAFNTGFVSVHTREHFLWVLRTGADKPISGPAWVLVDVGDPDKPRMSRIELLDPLPSDEPNLFALWNDRALFFVGSPGELAMWNLSTRTSLGGRVKPDAKAPDSPLLHCSESTCLSIMAEGADDKRRMVIRRIGKNGAETNEDVGPGVVAESMNFLWNDRIVTSWSRFDAKGLWARQIDAKSGEFNGATYSLGGIEPDIQDPQPIGSRNGFFLAWQAARVGWRIGKLDDDGIAVTDVLTLPASGSFLSAATTDDGIVAAIYSAGQDEERGGNEWYSSVRALFVPFGKTPTGSDVVALVDDEHGPGHGGFAGYAMGAPNAAAVLVTPQGNAQGDSFVMMLRKRCVEKK
jgi:hypothetical protein